MADAALLEALSGPHVTRAWFLELDLPSGWSYLHSGFGRKEIEGKTWRGVSDPIGGRLVSLSDLEAVQFGQASAMSVVLSGANKAFLQSVHSTARAIEGRSANLYFGVFDPETEEILMPLKRLLPGKMTSPKIQWQGVGVRTVSLTIEGRWASQNYPMIGAWNSAGQRKRHPGDLGLDFVGVETTETFA